MFSWGLGKDLIMEVTVEHLGAVKFQAKARTHTLVCDQPLDNGGSDQGMTPPELLLSSLATCAAHYAVQYLRKHKLAEQGIQVRVAAEKVTGPFRLDNFQIELQLPVDFPEAHRPGIERDVHHCLIHNTLLHPPQITLTMKNAAPHTLATAGAESASGGWKFNREELHERR
jgi:uncharacterized OsmC-like protein